MGKRGKYKFSIEGIPLYPHIKLTRERFPRILATRLIANDDAEYFGAFLNRSNARILLDFLNRTFRLRSCEIDVDGSFNYPCTMYYKRRCLAPCVADLVDDETYAEMVGLVRLFLKNEREFLRELLNTKIESAAADLRFESAAKFRDIMSEVEEYWGDELHAPWLDRTSDTFHTRRTNHTLDIFLISQKRSRVLGERVFPFPDKVETDAGQALSDVIGQFYKFHAPKEIRVSQDFPDRKDLERSLSSKFGRHVPILLLNQKNRKVSTELAVYRSSAELDVKRSIVKKSAHQLMTELKRIFSLPQIPQRILAIDVSHIAGTDQVAAAIAWENGKRISAQYLLSESESELKTLSELVEQISLHHSSNEPALLLIDGGQSQLNVASASSTAENVYLVSAVKPPDMHSEVSHFLTANQRIDFDPMSETHRLLQRLRDEAHEFANAVHADTRDFVHFYGVVNILPSLKESQRQSLLAHFGSRSAIVKSTREEIAKVIGPEHAQTALRHIKDYESGNSDQIKPLVVPVRFQDENGAAEDLRPIAAIYGKGKRRIR